MKPGAYLELRRKSAGLSLRRTADLAGGPSPLFAEQAYDQLAHFEATDEMLGAVAGWQTLINRLQSVFPFDREVLALLADRAAHPDNPDLPIPNICRTCGCSFNDPATA